MEDNFIEEVTAKAFIAVVDNYSDQVREVILKDIQENPEKYPDLKYVTIISRNKLNEMGRKAKQYDALKQEMEHLRDEMKKVNEPAKGLSLEIIESYVDTLITGIRCGDFSGYEAIKKSHAFFNDIEKHYFIKEVKRDDKN